MRRHADHYCRHRYGLLGFWSVEQLDSFSVLATFYCDILLRHCSVQGSVQAAVQSVVWPLSRAAVQGTCRQLAPG